MDLESQVKCDLDAH